MEDNEIYSQPWHGAATPDGDSVHPQDFTEPRDSIAHLQLSKIETSHAQCKDVMLNLRIEADHYRRLAEYLQLTADELQAKYDNEQLIERLEETSKVQERLLMALRQNAEIGCYSCYFPKESIYNSSMGKNEDSSFSQSQEQSAAEKAEKPSQTVPDTPPRKQPLWRLDADLHYASQSDICGSTLKKRKVAVIESERGRSLSNVDVEIDEIESD